MAENTAATRSRRITFRTTAAPGGSLAQARCDPHRLVEGYLGLEAIRDPTVLPEEGVAGESERFRLDVSRRVAEEELMGLAGEVVSDPRAERHRVERRAGADGLRHDLGREGCRDRRERPPVQLETRPPRLRASLHDPRADRGPEIASRAIEARADVGEGPLEVAVVESLSHELSHRHRRLPVVARARVRVAISPCRARI